MKDDVNMTEPSDSVKALFMFDVWRKIHTRYSLPARFCHKSWSRHLFKSIMRKKIFAFCAILPHQGIDDMMKKIPLSLSIIFSTNQYSKCDTFRWKIIQHSWSRERRAIYFYHLTADSWNYSAQCHSPSTVQRSQMFSEQKSSRWKLYPSF